MNTKLYTSNSDTIGPEESVLIREVSLFQGLKNMELGPEESVLIREVSLFQGLKSTQTWNLGQKKVSCLFQGCPYRGVPVHMHIVGTRQTVCITNIFGYTYHTEYHAYRYTWCVFPAGVS